MLLVGRNRAKEDPRGGAGLGGRMGGPGFGGPGGGMNQDLELVRQFDKDSSGWLNAQERQEARKYVEQENRRSPGGPGGPFGRRGFGREASPPQPGVKVTPAEVKAYSDAPLYASNVLRTVFLDFESKDWRTNLRHFTDGCRGHGQLTVDGRSYRMSGSASREHLLHDGGDEGSGR